MCVYPSDRRAISSFPSLESITSPVDSGYGRITEEACAELVHAIQPMALCDKCKSLPVYKALRSLQTESSGESQSPSCSISDWHASLRDIHQASARCNFCALVIKGWRQYRPVIVQSSLTSGDMNPDDSPRDLYDDILTIGPYQCGCIEVDACRNNSDYEGH